VKDADQGEQPARRTFIDLDIFHQLVFQQFRTFVMQAAPPHIDRFDL
jgi:hypothetical protein